MSIVLSEKQNAVKDAILEFANDPDPNRKVFTVAGYAGAGKTSMAKVVAKELGEENVTFCAYTGKAVNVLRDKGCVKVTTIHAAIYKAADHDKKRIEELRAEILEAERQGDMFKISRSKSEIDALTKEMMKPKFVMGDGNAFKGDALTIVDEYSMLDGKLVGDIIASGRKILFMGDPFQLPPIKDDCPLKPDVFIDEIHRQAMDSAIIRFSKDVREGRYIPMGQFGDLDHVHQNDLYPSNYLDADQVIVGRNATRAGINSWFRDQIYGHGHGHMYPMAGEKMICLKNNKAAQIFNGMIGECKEDADKMRDQDIHYQMKFDNCNEGMALHVWEGDIQGKGDDYNWNDFKMKSLNRFDYAYAITCHKSQGSEFNNVLVFNEPVGKTDIMRARWLYTAITRGKKKVTLTAA